MKSSTHPPGHIPFPHEISFPLLHSLLYVHQNRAVYSLLYVHRTRAVYQTAIGRGGLIEPNDTYVVTEVVGELAQLMSTFACYWDISHSLLVAIESNCNAVVQPVFTTTKSIYYVEKNCCNNIRVIAIVFVKCCN